MKDDDADRADEEAQVELTEEEKSNTFRRKSLPDMTPSDLAKSFDKFSLPESEDGFDEIRHEWSSADDSQKHFRDWQLGCKTTQRVEDIEPGEWFQDKFGKWSKFLERHKKCFKEWREIVDQLEE